MQSFLSTSSNCSINQILLSSIIMRMFKNERKRERTAAWRFYTRFLEIFHTLYALYFVSIIACLGFPRSSCLRWKVFHSKFSLAHFHGKFKFQRGNVRNISGSLLVRLPFSRIVLYVGGSSKHIMAAVNRVAVRATRQLIACFGL